MKPGSRSKFGAITIDGERIEHDVRSGFPARWRSGREALPRPCIGTSHTISLAEAEYIHERRAERLIVGAGQNGMVELPTQRRSILRSTSRGRSRATPGHRALEQARAR